MVLMSTPDCWSQYGMVMRTTPSGRPEGKERSVTEPKRQLVKERFRLSIVPGFFPPPSATQGEVMRPSAHALDFLGDRAPAPRRLQGPRLPRTRRRRGLPRGPRG